MARQTSGQDAVEDVHAAPDAFGAVCGGEVDVSLEVVMPPDRLLIVGGGQCSALAAIALAERGAEVTLLYRMHDSNMTRQPRDAKAIQTLMIHKSLQRRRRVRR